MSNLYREWSSAADLAEYAWIHFGGLVQVHMLNRSREYVIDFWTKALAGLWDVIEQGKQTGRVPVYRGVIVSHPRDLHWDNIGGCWSYKEHAASCMATPRVQPRARILHVRLHGNIAVGDVAWKTVLQQHLLYTNEYEIRAEPGAIISVTALNIRESPRGIGTLYPFKREVRAKVQESTDEWKPKR